MAKASKRERETNGLVWIFFTVIIGSAKGTSQPVYNYKRTIPDDYGTEKQILDLNPVIYNKVPGLHSYHTSIQKLYFQNEGFQDLSMINCFVTNHVVAVPSIYNQICFNTDANTLQTTKSFQSNVAAGLNITIHVNILKGSISGSISRILIIKIMIRSLCKAQESLSLKVRECQPSYHVTNSISFDDKSGTIFEIPSKFYKDGQPLVLSKITLTDKEDELEGSVFLTVIDVDDDNKSIVENHEISTLKGSHEAYFDVFDKLGSSKYKIILKNERGTVYKKQKVLQFYQLQGFCKKDAKCYQETSLWKDLKKQGDCGFNTVPLEANYERCIDESSGLLVTPHITISDKNPNLGIGLKISCNITGSILVPHTIHIEKLSSTSPPSTQLSADLEITKLEHSHKTFYRCTVKAYHVRLVTMTSDLYFLDIKNLFKTKLKFRLSLPFTESLRDKTSQDFFKLEKTLISDMKNLQFDSKRSEVHFEVIDFTEASGNVIVYGILSKMFTMNMRQNNITFYKWLVNLKYGIETDKSRNQSRKLVEILPYDACFNQSTTSQQSGDLYQWPWMKLDKEYIQFCRHNAKQEIKAKCVLHPTELHAILEILDDQCKKEESKGKINLGDVDDLATLATITVDANNAANVSILLQDLSRSAQDFEMIDVQSSVACLEKILEFLSVNQNISDYFFNSVDNILGVSQKTMVKSQQMNQTTTRLFEVIGKAGEKMSNDPPFIVGGKNFALGSLKVDTKTAGDLIATVTNQNKLPNGLLKLAVTGDSSSGGNTNDLNKSNGLNDVSIVIPSTITKTLVTPPKQNGRLDFVTVVYRNGEMLGSEQNAKGSDIGTYILSAEIRGQEITDTAENIKMTFKSREDNEPHDEKNSNFECVFWNVSKQAWSTSGMKSFYKEATAEYECLSNHLTNFAVMFNAKPLLNMRHVEILNVITYVGLAFNIAGALLTLLTYLIFPLVPKPNYLYASLTSLSFFNFYRILRENVPPKILMNLCIALIMLSIVFLVGAERTSKGGKEKCQAVAFLLQYSFLSVFSWSAIEGFHSTRGLVFPMKTDIRSFVKKSLPIGWGIPLIFTAIGFGVWKENYTSETNCVVNGMPFYVTVLLPVVTTMLFNIVALVAIMMSLKSSSQKYTTHALTPSQRARIITAFMILFGLTWVFGFLVINNDVVALQYLFCAISTLQGMYVFVFYGLRNQKVRLFWMALLRGESPHFIQRASTRQLNGKRARNPSDENNSTTMSHNYNTTSTVSNHAVKFGEKSKSQKQHKTNFYAVS